jgi:hypothetical protein
VVKLLLFQVNVLPLRKQRFEDEWYVKASLQEPLIFNRKDNLVFVSVDVYATRRVGPVLKL